MSKPQDAAPPVLHQPATSPDATAAPNPVPLLRKIVMAPVKLIIGASLCLNLTTSLLALGWTHRLAQRIALRHWWKRSTHKSEGGKFEDFALGDEATAGHAHWPNWFLGQNFLGLLLSPLPGGKIGPRLWDLFRALTDSLRRNLVLGIQAAFNLFLLTLPAGLMWWYGWDYGWNISFFKGYEQFTVGVTTFAVGSLLFIGTMFYLPLAQARQAVTGDWHAFWNIDLIINLIRGQWIWLLLLSGLIALLCLPVLILKTALPYSSESANIETVPQAIEFVQKYAFYSALFVFPAYVLIRVLAAKIYAHGLLRAVQEDRVDLRDLTETERAALKRLDLLESQPPVLQHWFWKIAGWLGSRIGQILSAGILFWVWLALVAGIVISEFFSYHEAGRAWWNQQLIQMPWFDYMPTYIAEEYPEEGLTSVAAQVGNAIFIALLTMSVRYAYQFFRDLIAKRRLPE